MLEQLHPHTRDKRLEFVPESHTYYIDGLPTIGSVTGLVQKFPHRFDADNIIEKMRNGPRWPRAGYLRREIDPESRLAVENAPLADFVLELWSKTERDEDGRRPLQHAAHAYEQAKLRTGSVISEAHWHEHGARDEPGADAHA